MILETYLPAFLIRILVGEWAVVTLLGGLVLALFLVRWLIGFFADSAG